MEGLPSHSTPTSTTVKSERPLPFPTFLGTIIEPVHQSGEIEEGRVRMRGVIPIRQGVVRVLMWLCVFLLIDVLVLCAWSWSTPRQISIESLRRSPSLQTGFVTKISLYHGVIEVMREVRTYRMSEFRFEEMVHGDANPSWPYKRNHIEKTGICLEQWLMFEPDPPPCWRFSFDHFIALGVWSGPYDLEKWYAAVSLLPVAGLLLILPLAAGACPAWRLSRAVRKGLCIRCGYDLRASPHRCPECGATAQRPARRPWLARLPAPATAAALAAMICLTPVMVLQYIVHRDAPFWTAHEMEFILLQAIQKSDVGQMRAALDAGADPNACDYVNNRSALSSAVEQEDPIELVKLLLERGASPDGKTWEEQYKPPAFRAIEPERSAKALELLQILIAHGAHANTRSSDCPLLIVFLQQHTPEEKDYLQILRLLLSAGADPNAKAPTSEPALAIALTRTSEAAIDAGKYAEIVEAFLAARADPKAADASGSPVLHVVWGQAPNRLLDLPGPCFDRLLARADVNARNAAGDTLLLRLAQEYDPQLHSDRNFDLAGKLLKAGANPNIPGWFHRTPLHYAVERSNRVLAIQLVDAGADPTIKDEVGKRPIDLASDKDREWVLKLLR
jgi:ankyrin repeat protein